MGKKKNKNKKNKFRYTKKQFIDIYCLNCDLCQVRPAEPIFCYEELYKTNPERFLECCFVGLIKEARELRESNSSSNDITLGKFRKLFCKSFCKQESCGIIVDCFNLFKDQVSGYGKKSNTKANIRKNKKEKQRKKYVCQPYPTMFTSDSEEWKTRIENILSNGNNNREQNKAKENAKQLEGQVNK